MGYKIHKVSLRLSDKMMSGLNEISEREQKSTSELIREAIELYLNKMEEK